MRDEDTNNPTGEADTTRRERERSLAERRRTAAKQRRGTVLESAANIAHKRHGVAIFEEAAWRQDLDLDNPRPVDASGDLGAQARATFGGRSHTAAEADAKAEAEADAADAKAEAEEQADAEARHGRDAERGGVDEDKLTPIQKALARLQKKQERARAPAPRLRPVPSLRRRPGEGLVGGSPIRTRNGPAPARANKGRGGPGPRF